jgi:hypothetical protein
MEHSQIVLDLLLPTDQQSPEAIEPGINTFDYPPPCSVASSQILAGGADRVLECPSTSLPTLAHVRKSPWPGSVLLFPSEIILSDTDPRRGSGLYCIMTRPGLEPGTY